MQIDYRVTSTVQRYVAGRELVDQLGATLHVDTQLRGPWPSSREVWQSIRGTHGVLIQDDCELVPNFKRHVEEIIRVRPHYVISLYRGWKFSEPRKPGSFIATNIRMNGPAVIMPRDEAADFVAWCDEWVRPEYHSYDTRIALWVRYTGRWFLFAEPNLVEHRQDLHSTMKGKGSNKGRFSRNFNPELPADHFWDPRIQGLCMRGWDVILTGQHKGMRKIPPTELIDKWHKQNRARRC